MPGSIRASGCGGSTVGYIDRIGVVVDVCILSDGGVWCGDWRRDREGGKGVRGLFIKGLECLTMGWDGHVFTRLEFSLFFSFSFYGAISVP